MKKSKYFYAFLGVLLMFFSLGMKKSVYAEEQIEDIRENGESYELLQVAGEEENENNDDKIHFISIGLCNDAILLESNGKYAMIDSGERNYGAGSVAQGCAPQVIHYLQKQGVQSLEFYLATHVHSDHIGNIDSILKTFPTKRVYAGEYDDKYISEYQCLWNNQWIYNNMLRAVKDNDVELIQDFSRTNDTFQFGDFTIRIYNYQRKVDENGQRVPVWDDNVNSLIVTVTLGNNTAVLSGDATPVSLNQVAKSVNNIAVFKMSHHGDYHNNTEEVLQKYNPKIIVQTGSEEILSDDLVQYVHAPEREYYTTVSDSAAVIIEFPADGESEIQAYYSKMDPDNFYEVEGEKYCFDENGRVLRGVQQIDGEKYYFDYAGAWLPNAKEQGWVKNKTGWWYRNYDGSYPYNAWKYIGNKWYYFDKNGYMVTGWKYLNHKYYYMNSSGAMQTGWIFLGGKYYYLNSSGVMQTGWVKVGKDWYYMNSSGVMRTEKLVSGGVTYNFKSSGQWIEPEKMTKEGWVHDSTGYWYRLVNGEWPANCWKKIDDAWYYFNKRGYRETGWLNRPEGNYYLDSDGKMQINWVNAGGNWYYMNGAGLRQTGRVVLDGNAYYLDPATGILQIGWFLYEDEMVYANNSGILREKAGWNLIEEQWYYLKKDSYGRTTGWLVFNEETDHEVSYYLNEEGVMVTGWQEIDGVSYYFDDSGALIPQEETEPEESE